MERFWTSRLKSDSFNWFHQDHSDSDEEFRSKSRFDHDLGRNFSLGQFNRLSYIFNELNIAMFLRQSKQKYLKKDPSNENDGTSINDKYDACIFISLAHYPSHVLLF